MTRSLFPLAIVLDEGWWEVYDKQWQMEWDCPCCWWGSDWPDGLLVICHGFFFFSYFGKPRGKHHFGSLDFQTSPPLIQYETVQNPQRILRAGRALTNMWLASVLPLPIGPSSSSGRSVQQINQYHQGAQC